ncbi:MAG TPA: protein kinase [Planctomycetaceae bacterium]|nr:protein kinase [Planctomycetaceae bacterium]
MTERELFEAAIELAPEDRAAYLDSVCGADAALRLRLEGLLRKHDEAKSFLEVPPPELAQTVNQPAIEEAGTQVGPYKLLEPIGEGGFGVVFMADQHAPVRRRVALKIIKPGMDSRQVLARFEVERQALALMDHPNIARALDAGVTASGRPYFVMELVRGVPITDYCDQANLVVHERLDLFVQVCRAVQHAHQKGIIHRDLKPSNILVTLLDGRPVPKVIDFGIAKAINQPLTQETLFTRFAEMIGTPLYMSPEQAEMTQLDIDTRSDIYSLGVLLYELLTGSTPFDKNRLKKAAYDEIRRIIREEEPPKPSLRISTLGEKRTVVAAHRHADPNRLSQLLRGDLDWIVMKALEKERSRRYETANGLAMDIERHLADEPVLACPPSVAYRFAKFTRRNRVAFTTSLVVLAAILAGTAVSVTQAIRATRAERQADARFQEAEMAREAEADQRQIADRQRQQAEENLKRARQAVDQYFTRVSQSKLFDVPTLQPLRKELLEDAVRYYQTLLSDRGENPALLADLAVADLRLAEIDHEVDRNDDAVDALASGLELVERLHTKYPDAKDELRSVAGFWKANRTPKAGTVMPKDRAKAQRTLMKFVKLWETLAREHPSVDAFQNDLAETHASLASWQTAAGDDYRSSDLTKAGIDSYHKAIEIWERLSQSHPEVPEYRENLVMELHELAQRLGAAGRQAEAQKLVVRELALTEQLAAQYPKVPQYRFRLASAWKYRGGFLQAAGNRRQAGDAFRRQFDVAKALFLEFPTVADYAVLTATGARDFLDCSNGSGMPDAAKWSRRELAPILTNINRLATNLPEDRGSRSALAGAFYHLGCAWGSAGERPAAESAWRQAILLYRRLAQEAPNDSVGRWQVGHALRFLAFDLGPGPEHRGDVEHAFREAIDSFQWLTVHEPKNIKNWHFLADTQRRLAQFLIDAQRPDEAEQEFRRAIETHEGALEKLHVEPFSEEEWAANYLDLVRFLESKGRSQAAEEVVRRFISRIEALRGAFPKNAAHPEWLARVHHELANSFRDIKRRDDAESHYRQALAQYDALAAAFPTNRDYQLTRANCHNDFGTLFWSAGRPADAEREYRQAVALKQKLVADAPANPDYRFHLAHSCRGLAALLNDNKRSREAEDSYRQTLALFEKLAGEFPSRDNYRLEVGHTLWHLANVAWAAGRLEEAEKQHRQALAIFEKLAVDFPQNRYYRFEQGFSDWNVAGVMRQQNRLPEAEKSYRDAADVYSKLAAEAPDDAECRNRVARSHFELAEVLQAENRLDEAEKHYRQAEATWRKLGADVPSEPIHRINAIWTSTYQLGPLAEAGSRTHEAEESYRNAADLLTKLPVTELVADDRRNMTDTCYGNLVSLLRKNNRAQEATAVIRAWLDLRRKTFTKILEQNPKSAAAHNNLAWTWATCAEAQFRDPARAVVLAKKAVELEPKQGMWWNTLGAAEYRAGDWKAALEALKKSMELRNGGDSFDWFFVAMANRQVGNQQEARKWYDKAVKRMFLNEELWRFRAEAASLLGTGESLPSFDEASKANRAASREWNHADASARLGRWDEALAAIDKAAELEPGNHWYLFHAAPLHLRAGDVAGYRRTCWAMLERFQETQAPNVAERTAKTCLLLPDAVPDFDRVQKLADRVVSGTEKHGDYRWFVFVKGLAEYRAGRHAEAVKWLERFGAHADGAHVDASAFAVLAMAQHRLGQKEQAHAALHSAQAIEKMPDPSVGRLFGGDWQNGLHCQILLREAEALLTNKSDVGDLKSANKQNAQKPK